jgi:hypothetical protein
VGAAAHGAGSPIQSQINTNAVLSSAQVAALSPAEQQQLNAARSNAALLQVATQLAYSTTSSRFASVQTLINAIASATDQKGILELQARIQAEQGMLQTDSYQVERAVSGGAGAGVGTSTKRARAGRRGRGELAHAGGAAPALRDELCDFGPVHGPCGCV